VRPPRAEGEVSDTDARLWHPWLRINRSCAWCCTSGPAGGGVMSFGILLLAIRKPDREAARPEKEGV
jgi:hypothetical protein